MTSYLGGLALLLVQVVRNGVTPPYQLRLILREIDVMGVSSLTVANLAALFTGMVLVLQTSYYLGKFGAKSYVGPVVALSVFRELGPVLTALLVGGKVGSGITAELGSMKATEQIDALRVIGANYIKRLVVPKVAAALVVFPLLTVIADVLGILGGMFIALSELRIDSVLYLNSITQWVVLHDLMSGLSKTVVFGLIISLIACHNGLGATGGTEGLGRATTATVVTASISVIVSDFFLTKLFFLL
ncbi:MAG: ABC transporter permease [Deltaproteobacteria bacterium]|nr:ABC transporter permease [Deltaproteobacteria bacterium]MBI3077978.1 ABC transporter permease [Deltaproteobacteria bacterium]